MIDEHLDHVVAPEAELLVLATLRAVDRDRRDAADLADQGCLLVDLGPPPCGDLVGFQSI